jgi:hypothetical protein
MIVNDDTPAFTPATSCANIDLDNGQNSSKNSRPQPTVGDKPPLNLASRNSKGLNGDGRV